MPERLDRVTIALDSGDITIPWNARETLMRRLLHVGELNGLRNTFKAVGATRPVTLTGRQRVRLLEILEEWSADGAGYGPMSEELNALRDALAEEHRTA